MTQVSGLVGRADLICALFTLAALFSYRKCLDCKRNGVYNTFRTVYTNYTKSIYNCDVMQVM